MDIVTEGFIKAFRLIFAFNPELFEIIFLSLRVSCLALFIASVLALPLAAFIGLKRFPAKGLIISSVNAFMGIPPVVVGLFAYLLLSRSGPLGFMGLLYTPSAMVIVQTILAFPIILSLCHTAILSVDPVIRQASLALGATPFQMSAVIINEARYGIMSGIITALGRLMAEVGAVLIVGGNIAGYTRVMTTTIALETDKGNFEIALALGIVLLAISLIINIFLHVLQGKGAVHS